MSFPTSRVSRVTYRVSRVGVTLVAAGLSLAVAGCGASSGTAAPAASTSAAAHDTASGSTGHHSHSITLESGWAEAGSGMTAVFGTVRNASSHPVSLVRGATGTAGAVEVHTMAKQADGTMRMTVKPGGLVIPAGGSATLAPGGDHIMLLDLARPLVNGEEIQLVMTSDEGEDLTWTVPVRSFAGADETYAPEHPEDPTAPTAPTVPGATTAGHAAP